MAVTTLYCPRCGVEVGEWPYHSPSAPVEPVHCESCITQVIEQVERYANAAVALVLIDMLRDTQPNSGEET